MNKKLLEMLPDVELASDVLGELSAWHGFCQRPFA